MCRTQETGLDLVSGFARGRLTVSCLLQVTCGFQLQVFWLNAVAFFFFLVELIVLCEAEFSFVWSCA
jgi:hypothetical protein